MGGTFLGIDLGAVDSFVHPTTAGLNAFLERRGPRVPLETTAAFRDVYEIGRANRPTTYEAVSALDVSVRPKCAIFSSTSRSGSASPCSSSAAYAHQLMGLWLDPIVDTAP